MEMWIKFLILLCAAYKAFSADLIGLKIKYLAATDTDDHKSEKFMIRFEGELSKAITDYKYFHLQILEVLEGVTVPFIKELVVVEATEVEPTKFSVIFPYETEGDTGIVAELLEKKLNLVFVVKTAAVDLVAAASGTAKVDLTLVTAIPTSTGLMEISDPKEPKGRWIRINEITTGPFLGGTNIIPLCDVAPCYAYEHPDDIATTYIQCNDVTDDSASVGDEIYFCSDKPSTITSIAQAGVDPVKITLDHENKNLQVSIKDDVNSAKKIDLVFHQSTATSTIPTTCGGEPMPGDTNNPVKCPITIEPDTEEYKILLVSYTTVPPAGPWFTSYTFHNHLLGAQFLSTDLLEAHWDHTKNVGFQKYDISRNKKDESDKGLLEAYVDCTSVENPCSAYFIGVPADIEYQVTIQDMISYPPPKLAEVSIRSSNALRVKTSPKGKIEFQVIPIDSVVTTVSGSSIELDVCFKYITNASTADIRYEFLAVNSEGKWKKEININKKDEVHACFHGIELPLVDFSENSKFFVLMRDSIKGNSLASGEVSIKIPAALAIKPEVDNGNNGSTSTLAIVGAAIAGIACLMALVAAAVMFVMKINRNNDGLQYPLQHNNIEDSSTIHGLDNSIPTM